MHHCGCLCCCCCFHCDNMAGTTPSATGDPRLQHSHLTASSGVTTLGSIRHLCRTRCLFTSSLLHNKFEYTVITSHNEFLLAFEQAAGEELSPCTSMCHIKDTFVSLHPTRYHHHLLTLSFCYQYPDMTCCCVENVTVWQSLVIFKCNCPDWISTSIVFVQVRIVSLQAIGCWCVWFHRSDVLANGVHQKFFFSHVLYLIKESIGGYRQCSCLIATKLPLLLTVQCFTCLKRLFFTHLSLKQLWLVFFATTVNLKSTSKLRLTHTHDSFMMQGN